MSEHDHEATLKAALPHLTPAQILALVALVPQIVSLVQSEPLPRAVTDVIALVSNVLHPAPTP